jgi:toxin-antitoxin system PIN domain toxin
MKLPDINIWLAVILSGHSHHASTMNWLEEQRMPKGIFLCRITQQGVLRLLTTAVVMEGYGIPPLSNREAWDVMESLMADDRIAFSNEPAGLDKAWRAFALRETHSPKLWMDAYLAAFAMQSRYELVTTDKAFTQFQGLDLHLVNQSTP